MIYYLIVAAVIVFDQLVKYAVRYGMNAGDSIALLENVFHITYIRNRGAAFSMWEQQWIVLIAVPLAVIAVGLVLLYMKRKVWSRPMLVSVAFICGGGLGNLIDRMTCGYVVDMFDCRFFPFFDFPVFNIADIFICTGCGLLLLDVIFLEGKRAKK